MFASEGGGEGDGFFRLGAILLKDLLELRDTDIHGM